MKILLKLLFILLIIFNIYCVNSQKENITLFVDFSSSIDYEQYKCGGSFIKEDDYQYPPCKSIQDVGHRSSIFNQQFPKSNNTNLIINVTGNGNDTIMMTNENVTFGNLMGYCSFEIMTNSKQLIIDGSKLIGSNNSFINYLGMDIRFTYCKNGKKSIKLSNTKFINWKDNLIFSNNVLDYNYNGFVSITFDKIITDNSNRFIGIGNNGYNNVNSIYDNDTIDSIILPFTFNLICCNFTNSISQNSNFINIQNSNFIVKSSNFINQSITNSNLYQFKQSYILYLNVLFDNINIIENKTNDVNKSTTSSSSSPPSGRFTNMLSIFKMDSFIFNFNKITIQNSRFSKLINGNYNDNFNGVNDDHSNIINNLFCNCQYRNNVIGYDQISNNNQVIYSPLFQISMPVSMNSYGIILVNNSFTNNTINKNKKVFLSINDGFNVRIESTELPSEFSIAFDINNSNISIEHHCIINSNVLVQGNENSIQIEYGKTPNYILYNPIKINSTCINCDLSFIKINSGHHTSDSNSDITINGFSYVEHFVPKSNSGTNSSSDNYNDNNLFSSSGMKVYSRNRSKNIILHIALPIVLGSIFLSVLFLGLAFRKKIFYFISKDRSSNVSKSSDKIENEMQATCEIGGDSPNTNDDTIDIDEENYNNLDENNNNNNNLNNKFSIDYQNYVDN